MLVFVAGIDGGDGFVGHEYVRGDKSDVSADGFALLCKIVVTACGA